MLPVEWSPSPDLRLELFKQHHHNTPTAAFSSVSQATIDPDFERYPLEWQCCYVGELEGSTGGFAFVELESQKKFRCSTGVKSRDSIQLVLRPGCMFSAFRVPRGATFAAGYRTRAPSTSNISTAYAHDSICSLGLVNQFCGRTHQFCRERSTNSPGVRVEEGRSY